MPYGTFTLTGRHTTPSRKAHAGQVTVTPNAVIRDTDGDVVMSGAEKVPLDAEGAWSLVLPCDSPSLNPSSGIGYTVAFSLYASGVSPLSFYATDDLAGTVLDVSDIVSVSLPTALSAIVGPAGADGAPGATGPQGLTGPQGVKGADGAQGPQGIQGATGPQGASGPKGDPGTTTWAGITDKPTATDLGAATAAQGAKADSAVQPTTLAPVSTRTMRALARQPVPATTRAAPAFQTGNGISDGVTQGGTAVVRHLVVVTGSAVRLLYTNHYPAPTGGATEVDGTDTITVRASIEPVSGGTRIPVSVNGAREFTIPPGGSVITDPLGIDVVRGTNIWSWTYVSVTAGQKFPRGAFALASGASEGHGYTASGTPGADVTLTGTRPTTINEYVYGPASILVHPASPDLPTVGLVGDSITAGTGDNQRGWAEASLDARYSFQKVAYPSEQMSKWVDLNGATRYRRLGFLARVGVTHILALHGRNDMDIGITLLKQQAVNYWLTLSRFAQTWAHTVTPYTTSTDAWATVANQSLFGTSETNRVDYNTWLRDGAPINASTKVPVAVGGVGVRVGEAGHPLAGILEVADLAESSRNSGKWKAGYTADGLHPNTTGANGIRDGGGRTMLGNILGAQAT